MENAVLFGVSKAVLLAFLTGAFTLVSFVMLLRHMQAGRLPYVWAWVVRLSICAVAFASQLAGGASYSLMLSGGQVLVCASIILFVARRQPRPGKLDSLDWYTLAVAGLGVVVWLGSGNPLFGILGVIVADAGATVMGVRAAMRRGTQESAVFWGCAFAAAATAVLSTSEWRWVILLAPLFSCLNALINIATIWFVHRRKRQQVLAQPVVDSAAL